MNNRGKHMAGRRNASKPAGEKSTSNIIIRVHPEVKDSFRRAAGAVGKSLSQWLIDLGLAEINNDEDKS